MMATSSHRTMVLTGLSKLLMMATTAHRTKILAGLVLGSDGFEEVANDGHYHTEQWSWLD